VCALEKENLGALIPCCKICNLYFHEAKGQYICVCRCVKYAGNSLHSSTWKAAMDDRPPLSVLIPIATFENYLYRK
jgi:hypothetical protein